jgi:hypothetical protein
VKRIKLHLRDSREAAERETGGAEPGK